MISYSNKKKPFFYSDEDRKYYEMYAKLSCLISLGNKIKQKRMNIELYDVFPLTTEKTKSCPKLLKYNNDS